MSTATTKPVLIVGAGPTGLTAAMELTRFGIPVRIVEKRPAPLLTSRAIGVQARTLELLHQRGLAAEMIRIGNKGRGAVIHGEGNHTSHIDLSRIQSPFPYILFIPQADTERILAEQLARQGVAVERSVELIAIGQSESGVTGVLRRPDGDVEEIEASWLIDAEGAHSIIRTSLGLDFEGESFDRNVATGDFCVEGDLSDEDAQIFVSEHGFVALFPLGNRRFRMIAANPLSDPSRNAAPDLAELQKIYDMRSPIPARFHHPIWSAWFRIDSRMIGNLRRGRVFLGGDAAHIHSPAGAQGMNTGIQDMINLCWKLALVMRGQAAPALLDTYSEDRIPVIRAIVVATAAMTKAVDSKNPLFRSLFDRLMPSLAGTEFAQDRATQQMSQIALNYRESSLSETHAHRCSIRAGDRVPDTGSLHSLLDPSRFTLVCVGQQADIGFAIEPWRELITVHRIECREGISSLPVLILVRPDAYVCFTGYAESSSHLVAWLSKWLPYEKPL